MFLLLVAIVENVVDVVVRLFFWVIFKARCPWTTLAYSHITCIFRCIDQWYARVHLSPESDTCCDATAVCQFPPQKISTISLRTWRNPTRYCFYFIFHTAATGLLRFSFLPPNTIVLIHWNTWPTRPSQTTWTICSIESTERMVGRGVGRVGEHRVPSILCGA